MTQHSQHIHLLKQAYHLATKEPQRPLQASLRRSISASYYALFHRLVDEATCMFISRGKRRVLRECVSRAFRHSEMRVVCRALAGSNPPSNLVRAFEPLPVEPRLVAIARAFRDLQEVRHQADYNTYRQLSREEALHYYELADRAVEDWKHIRKSPQADAFLASLLLVNRIQG